MGPPDITKKKSDFISSHLSTYFVMQMIYCSLDSDVLLRCCGLTEGEMCLRVDFLHANLPEIDNNLTTCTSGKCFSYDDHALVSPPGI